MKFIVCMHLFSGPRPFLFQEIILEKYFYIFFALPVVASSIQFGGLATYLSTIILFL